MKICVATMVGPDDDAHEAWLSARPLLADDQFLDTTPGVITDFAFARNELLARCAAEGYDWAIMLDTDERIHSPHRDPRIFRDGLAQTDGDVLMVKHVGGTYEKERIFRLPAKGHYRGRTHEAFIVDDGAKRVTIAASMLTFDEVPKTPEQYRAKVERDLPLLQEQIRETPDDPRWWYYLGDTESGLGHPREASAAFQRCWELNGWDEESAWAAYRVAEILSGESKFNEAILWCTNGMLRHPGMAELPWLAGWCCYQMGQYRKAIWWEEMAIALNLVYADHERIGFRYPPVFYEAPHDVLRHAYRQVGEEAIATAQEERFAERLALRQETEKNRGTSREARVM